MPPEGKMEMGQLYVTDTRTGQRTEVGELKEVELSKTVFSDTPRETVDMIKCFGQTEFTITGKIENPETLYDIIIDSLKKNTLIATNERYDTIIVNNEKLAQEIKETFGAVYVIVNEYVPGVMFYNSETL